MALVEQVLPGLLGHVLELLDPGGHRHQANVRCAVTVHAYVLIQTDVGRAAHVAQQVNAVEGVVVAEGVTGPYDVIARAEAPSMNDLGRMVVRRHPADRGHHPHHHLSRREDLSDHPSNADINRRAHAP